MSVAPPREGLVTVLGAGSWGTALALHAHRCGLPTRLWARSEAHAEAMIRERVNARYLPQSRLPDDLEITAELVAALDGAALVIAAIPSHGMRETMARAREALAALAAAGRPARPYYLIASKGIEVESLRTMIDVLEDELPPDHRPQISVLGGPSFASEVASGLPTAVVVASRDRAVAEAIQRLLAGPGLRVYVSDDVLGVELGGSFKNVIALAAGVCDGAGLGQNARAALITRGLAEITRLSLVMGAHPATLAGLAGLGDLVLTCTGGLSRNRRVGLALGEGRALRDILAEMGMVAEGVKNTLSAHRLAAREGVEMPITAVMHAILYEDLEVRRAVAALMQRDLKPERG